MGIYFVYGEVTKLKGNQFSVKEAFYLDYRGEFPYLYNNKILDRKTHKFRFMDKRKRGRVRLLWLTYWIETYSINYKNKLCDENEEIINKNAYLHQINGLCRRMDKK